jgi:hypothetical protein
LWKSQTNAIVGMSGTAWCFGDGTFLVHMLVAKRRVLEDERSEQAAWVPLGSLLTVLFVEAQFWQQACEQLMHQNLHPSSMNS